MNNRGSTVRILGVVLGCLLIFPETIAAQTFPDAVPSQFDSAAFVAGYRHGMSAGEDQGWRAGYLERLRAQYARSQPITLAEDQWQHFLGDVIFYRNQSDTAPLDSVVSRTFERYRVLPAPFTPYQHLQPGFHLDHFILGYSIRQDLVYRTVRISGVVPSASYELALLRGVGGHEMIRHCYAVFQRNHSTLQFVRFFSRVDVTGFGDLQIDTSFAVTPTRHIVIVQGAGGDDDTWGRILLFEWRSPFELQLLYANGYRGNEWPRNRIGYIVTDHNAAIVTFEKRDFRFINHEIVLQPWYIAQQDTVQWGAP